MFLLSACINLFQLELVVKEIIKYLFENRRKPGKLKLKKSNHMSKSSLLVSSASLCISCSACFLLMVYEIHDWLAPNSECIKHDTFKCILF